MLKKISLLIFISVFVAGCGFKLRGTGSSLPEIFKHSYLNFAGSADDYLNNKIQNLITLNGGSLVDKKDAKININISNISESSRQIALSGDFALKEYEKNYTITVSVTDSDAGLQLGSRELTTVEYLQLDDRKILAGEEQSKITKEIASRKLANLVVQYLKTF